MQDHIIVSSVDVSKLKKKARALKKSSGIAYHEGLDKVAQNAGFNHWHHVTELANIFMPTEQAYRFGVIVAMDAADALDITRQTDGFVMDPLAIALCADDIFRLLLEEDGLSSGDDDYQQAKIEWMEDEGAMDYAFYRYTGSAIPKHLNEVVSMVRTFSFWPPQFIWHKGKFYKSPSDVALDENGKVVGFRF